MSKDLCTYVGLLCVLLWVSAEWFTHIFQGYFSGTVSLIQLTKSNWSNLKQYVQLNHN